MKDSIQNFRHNLPRDLAQLFNSNKAVREKWDQLTPLARNEWICWVTIVKRKDTRQEHLIRLQEDLLRGQKRPCCWPGCPHRRARARKWFK